MWLVFEVEVLRRHAWVYFVLDYYSVSTDIVFLLLSYLIIRFEGLEHVIFVQ